MSYPYWRVGIASLIPVLEGGYCESHTRIGGWVLLVSYPYWRVGIASLIPVLEGGYC